jgi:hypothetical protein
MAHAAAAAIDSSSESAAARLNSHRFMSFRQALSAG